MGFTSSKVNSQVLADAIFQETVNILSTQSDWYRLLAQEGRIKPASSAKGIEWHPIVSKHNVDSFVDGDPALADSEADTIDALLDWGQYQATTSISDLGKKKLESGLNGLKVDYFQNQVESLAQSFADKISTDAMAGDTGKGIVGNTAAAAATGTYAGVSRVTYPEFACYVLNVGGALTETHMNTAAKMLMENNSGRFSHVIGSMSTLGAMSGFTNIQQVITTQDVNGPGVVGQFGMGSGFERLQPMFIFKGAKVIPVANWPDGRIDFFDLRTKNGPRIEIFQNMEIQALAKTSTMNRMLVTMYLQYAIKNPKKACAVLTGIV